MESFSSLFLYVTFLRARSAQEISFFIWNKLMTKDAFGTELFHYTNVGGLRGIFESGTMYATRYDRLNDSTEISHFKDILTDLVVHRLDKDRDFLSFPEKKKQVSMVISSLYEEVFGTRTENGLAVPYITSFCSHYDDHSYERENGLLSQWRGYGGIEKYALVFDTAALMHLAQQEFDSYAYTFRAFRRVRYNDDEAGKAPEYGELANNIVETIRANKNQDTNAAVDWAELAYKGIVEHSTAFKHRAFREEREVRMVYSPTTKFVQSIYKTNPDYREEKPFKEIFTRNPNDIPTIRMFERFGTAKNLPLLRIIVGPSNSQEQALKMAEEITKGTVPLVCSKTPFL